MVYKGNVCDGCGKVFGDNDDIVVCPECATPQHRECYDKNSCCVNEHLHNEGFEWKGTVVQPKPSFSEGEKKEETSPCPNCGHRNAKGTPKCAGCGMKLVVFGIDLAESIEKQGDEQQELSQDAEDSHEISHYEPPFELGTGEGFDSEDEKTENTDTAVEESGEQAQPDTGATPTPEQISENIAQSFAQSAQDFINNAYVDGVNANLIAALVGPNSYKYIEKFKSLEIGRKYSFNWAAFFFTSYWFFYRKLYKAGIIILTITMMMSIGFTPIMEKTMEAHMDEFAEQFPFKSAEEFEALFGEMTEAEIEEFTNETIKQMMEVMAPLFAVMLAMLLLNLIIGLICGFTADKLYKKETLQKAKDVMGAKTKNEASLIVAKLGGVSAIAVLIVFFAEQLLSTLASQLMY